MTRRVVGTVAVALVLVGAAIVFAQPATRPAHEAAGTAKRVLVYTQTLGYRHASIPVAIESFREIGKSSGAFSIEHSEDPSVFDRLGEFDAVVFCNTTGELPLSDAQKQALLAFVRGGKGFVGAHSAADTLHQWPEYGEMIGAYFDGHPWQWNDTVAIKVEWPDDPIASPFGAGTFTLMEETYQFKAPYDRARLKVLMSLDTAKTDMRKPDIKRTDGDFAIAWTRPFGQGRVFYTALGHNAAVWKDPRMRKHVESGLRWVLRM